MMIVTNTISLHSPLALPGPLPKFDLWLLMHACDAACLQPAIYSTVFVVRPKEGLAVPQLLASVNLLT